MCLVIEYTFDPQFVSPDSIFKMDQKVVRYLIIDILYLLSVNRSHDSQIYFYLPRKVFGTECTVNTWEKKFI